MTNEEKVIRFREIVNDMADLYEKKNKNYGNSFGELFEKLGPISGLVPLHNKLDRATNLVNGGVNNFESLEDTFKDLACYAIMNLIEMEAQKNKENDSVEELKKYITGPRIVLDGKLTTSPNITFEGNRDIGFGDPIPTVIDPCEGCETKKMLSQGINYLGDLPCQWCSKNPLRFTCVSGGITSTHTLSTRTTKGETNSEK